jgi:hypothetical protein
MAHGLLGIGAYALGASHLVNSGLPVSWLVIESEHGLSGRP